MSRGESACELSESIEFATTGGSWQFRQVKYLAADAMNVCQPRGILEFSTRRGIERSQERIFFDVDL